MNLTEAYEVMKVKVNARSNMRQLQSAKLLLTKTTFEKTAIRNIIEAEKENNKIIFAKWPEAKRLIEAAEDFNARQLV